MAGQNNQNNHDNGNGMLQSLQAIIQLMGVMNGQTGAMGIADPNALAQQYAPSGACTIDGWTLNYINELRRNKNLIGAEALLSQTKQNWQEAITTCNKCKLVASTVESLVEELKAVGVKA